MLRFLARTALSLIGNAIGLIVAATLLDDMSINGAAFVIAVGIFTLVELLTLPALQKAALRQSEALAGGSALIATFVALVVTAIVSDGLSINGASTWLFATVIVWAATMLAAWLLPLFLFKKTLERARD